MPTRPSAPPPPLPAVEPMSGRGLKVSGERLFGARGWQKGLAEALDLDVSTIRRYVDSDRVPLVVAAAIRHLERLQRAEGPDARTAHDPASAPPGAVRQRSSVGR